jgi:hypothetical protein
MEHTNDTLDLSMRDMSQIGGDLSDILDELVEQFHAKRNKPNERPVVRRKIDILMNDLGKQVLKKYYRDNLRKMYDSYMDDMGNRSKYHVMDTMFSEYINNVTYVDIIVLNTHYITNVSPFTNFSEYEIVIYISTPLMYYFDGKITHIQFVRYIEKLLNVIDSDMIVYELLIGSSEDTNFTSVIYKIFQQYIIEHTKSSSVYERFEKLMIYLIEYDSDNVCLISPYMLSYTNPYASGRNTIFEHLEQYDIIHPIAMNFDGKYERFYVYVCKRYEKLNDAIKIIDNIDSSLKLLKCDLTKRIKSDSRSELSCKLTYYLVKYCDRKDMCLIKSYLSPNGKHNKFVNNIDLILAMYRLYDKDERVRNLCNLVCNVNDSIRFMYEVYHETSLGELMYYMFRSIFGSYRNFRIDGLFKWYDFSIRNIYGRSLIEEYMVDVYNNDNWSDISESWIGIIYGMKNMIGKNNDGETIVNVYIQTLLRMQNDEGPYFVDPVMLVHILNRMIQLHSENVIKETMRVKYEETLLKDGNFNNIYLVQYYLVKFDMIDYDDIEQLTQLIYDTISGFSLIYEYVNHSPHKQKYRLEETIEKNYGIKTLERLVNKAYSLFPIEDVTTYFQDGDILHFIASINYIGDDNDELITIAIGIIDKLIDNGYNINSNSWLYDAEYYSYGRSAIYFATNNRIIEHLLLKRIQFDIDIFNIVFSSVGDFRIWEQLFEDMFGKTYMSYIQSQFDMNEDTLINFFINSLTNSYLQLNQWCIDKYIRYGIISKIASTGRKIIYINPLRLFNLVSPYTINFTRLLMSPVFNRISFNEYQMSDTWETNIRRFAKNAVNERHGVLSKDMYTQFITFDENLKDKPTMIDMCDMKRDTFPILSVDILNIFIVPWEVNILSQLAHAIEQNRVQGYVNTNNELLLKIQTLVDKKYQKYIDMYDISVDFNKKSVEYLNSYRHNNLKYYEVLDDWMFGNYRTFNEELQNYEKPLTKEILDDFVKDHSIRTEQLYMIFRNSIILTEIILSAPRPKNELITYRGLDDITRMPSARYLVGTNIVFTRFTSVTPNYNVAFEFTKKNDVKDYARIMTIIIPANACCINLVTTEDEIVLPRYSILHYIGDNRLIYIGYNVTTIDEEHHMSKMGETYIPNDNAFKRRVGKPLQITHDSALDSTVEE